MSHVANCHRGELICSADAGKSTGLLRHKLDVGKKGCADKELVHTSSSCLVEPDRVSVGSRG